MLFIKSTYLFFDLFLVVSESFDDLPELEKLIERYFAIAIEVDRVEELVCRDLSKAHLLPVLLRLGAIYRFVTVLIEYFENFCHQLSQLMSQLL